MTIEIINDLSMRLVADDFSNGHRPNQAGPTKTSRAMAIIHLAAHDAYAMVTGKFSAKLADLPPPPNPGGNDSEGTIALLGAGFRVAELLYPDFAETIELDRKNNTSGADQNLLEYGTKIGEKWFEDRCTDGWQEPQEDKLYDKEPGKHRPDPFNPNQMTLGRKWGLVKPFVLGKIEEDAPLVPPPNLTEQDYADAYDQPAIGTKSATF